MKGTKVFQLSVILALVVAIAACSEKKTKPLETDGHTHETAKTQSVIKVFENVDVSVKTQINELLANYFSVNKALIDDNNESAKTEAKMFADNLAKFDMSKLEGEQMDFYHIQLAKISTGLKNVMESVDIEASRTGLADVSEGMYALIKAYRPSENELYLQFCPMAKNNEGAYWISNTKEIVNPYMGQMMPACGVTKEEL